MDGEVDVSEYIENCCLKNFSKTISKAKWRSLLGCGIQSFEQRRILCLPLIHHPSTLMIYDLIAKCQEVNNEGRRKATSAREYRPALSLYSAHNLLENSPMEHSEDSYHLSASTPNQEGRALTSAW
eukprot:TRINITY_DN6733_c0_g1_i1.p2 TRINITY_DN6733_c0_g1~~TRINITY_DN6733_c0_g1_i1.p2  ORF type:complete len:126 (+),score=7.03 TRINITY_DN6733_c0_g1_i1:369-746(+)